MRTNLFSFSNDACMILLYAKQCCRTMPVISPSIYHLFFRLSILNLLHTKGGSAFGGKCWAHSAAILNIECYFCLSYSCLLKSMRSQATA